MHKIKLNNSNEDIQVDVVTLKVEKIDSPFPSPVGPVFSNNHAGARLKENEPDFQESQIKVEIAPEDENVHTKIKVEIIPEHLNDVTVEDDFNIDMKQPDMNMSEDNPSNSRCEYKNDGNSLSNHEELHCDETKYTDNLHYRDKEEQANQQHKETPQCNENAEKLYSCSYCDYKSSHKSSVVYHERIHTGEKPYACKICNYRSTTNANLIKHTKQHTGEKQYACTHCDYRSNYKVGLIRHSRLHTGEKPYKCNYCNYRSNDKGHLTKHSRRHTGEKPYECKYCDYRSARKTSLIVHIRQHTGEKPYACEYCDYRGINKSHLDRHSRCHTGEKPYECGNCDYRSNDRANLLRHMRRQGHLTVVK